MWKLRREADSTRRNEATEGKEPREAEEKETKASEIINELIGGYDWNNALKEAKEKQPAQDANEDTKHPKHANDETDTPKTEDKPPTQTDKQQEDNELLLDKTKPMSGEKLDRLINEFDWNDLKQSMDEKPLDASPEPKQEIDNIAETKSPTNELEKQVTNDLINEIPPKAIDNAPEERNNIQANEPEHLKEYGNPTENEEINSAKETNQFQKASDIELKAENQDSDKNPEHPIPSKIPEANPTESHDQDPPRKTEENPPPHIPTETPETKPTEIQRINEQLADKNAHIELRETNEHRHEISLNYGEHDYPIKQIETRQECKEQVHKFQLVESGYFEYWTKQEQLIPPWRTEWYNLSDGVSAHLKDGRLKSLVEEAVGNNSPKKAAEKIKESTGEHISFGALYDFLEGKNDSIQVKNLRVILSHLDRPYEEMNRDIEGIGKGKLIENPNLPIDLNNREGSRIIMGILTDGCLSVNEKGHYINYSPYDETLWKQFAQDMEQRFGKIAPSLRRDEGQIVGVNYQTRIVGDILIKAGIPPGRKTETHPHIPEFIRNGTKEIQKEALRQYADTEGYVGKKSIVIATSINIDNYLTLEQKSALDKLDQVKSKNWSKKYERYELSLTELRKADDVCKTILSHKPNVMSDAREMLKGTFQIQSEPHLARLFKTKSGYSAGWQLIIRRKGNILKFNEEIGFASPAKKERLNEFINESARKNTR